MKSLFHPFELNLFEMNTGKILNHCIDNEHDYISLLTMNYSNRKITIGDIFEFKNFYFIFSAYKEHISSKLPDIKTFNFLIIEKDTPLFNNKFSYAASNSIQFEHAYLKDIDNDKFENKFKFIGNYFYNDNNLFEDNKIISNYLMSNNNLGIRILGKNNGYILFDIAKLPLKNVKELLTEKFTFYIITDFVLFDMLKKMNVYLGDIYCFTKINSELQQNIDYYLREGKISKKELENTMNYYSSIIHILDKNCELQQISLYYLNTNKENNFLIDYIPNLFWLAPFQNIKFDLKNKEYLKKYLLLLD